MHTGQRLTSLVVGILVSLASGTVYCYGIYSPQLMSHLGLTASDSATISLATNLGSGCGGLPGGYVIDHFGPRVAIIIGSLGIFFGYYVVYLCYADDLATVLGICAAMTAVGFGSITSYFACLKAAQANFPKHRGAAGAAPVSAYGLSATVFSIVATVFFHNNTGGLLQFFAIFCGLVAFIGSWWVEIYLDQDDEIAPPPPDGYWTVDGGPQSETSTLAEVNATISQPKHSIQPWEVITRRLSNKVYLLHFSVVSLAAGIGQMYIYSVGFIVTAQEWYNGESQSIQHLQAIQVALISISSFSGRVFAGFFSDWLYNRQHSRLWIPMFTSFILGTGQLITIVNVSDPIWLSVASILIGLSYGLMFGSYPAVIADQFGTRTFSTTWGLTCVGPFFTLLVLNKLFGWIYDANSSDEGICVLGNQCYQGVFGLSAALCLVMAAIVGYVIYWKRPQGLTTTS